jgi:transposase InsO family protein
MLAGLLKQPKNRQRGRPAHAPEVFARTLRRVARAWKDAGRSSGEGQVYAALGGEVPLRVLREHLRRLKAHWRKSSRRRRARDRVSLQVQARDVVWPLDATHLGRDEQGEVQAEALRDAASVAALSVSVGRPSTGPEVVALLERTSVARGGAPLVLAVDCGSSYAAHEVVEWAERRGVVILQSLPRVPEHNACAERGHRELKEDTDLGKGRRLEPLPGARWTLVDGLPGVLEGMPETSEGPDHASEAGPEERREVSTGPLPRWCRRIERSVQVLNESRARPSRGGWTARALDAALPRGDHLICRESFLRTVRRNIDLAVAAAQSTRARRLARRRAILCTLESYGLIQQTRGGRPWSSPISESQA